jgi:hypothetical protein
VINYIQVSCCIKPIGSPTIIYEDNAACIAQMQSGYMKSNVTKHITPKLKGAKFHSIWCLVAQESKLRRKFLGRPDISGTFTEYIW